jgi:hypothetical protein
MYRLQPYVSLRQRMLQQQVEQEEVMHGQLVLVHKIVQQVLLML